MSTELIFYTQIASLVAFFVALFGLYRALVSQKDATIELLRERIAQLERQSPDPLLDSVTKRYRLALEEIERRDVDEAERKRLLAQALEEAQRDARRKLRESGEELLAQIDRMARERK